MASKRKYVKSSSKTIKITCRVEECQLQMNRQSYKDHLVRIHPKVDSNDLREYNDRLLSINSWLTRSSGSSSLPRGNLRRGPGDNAASGRAPGEEQVEMIMEKNQEELDTENNQKELDMEEQWGLDMEEQWGLSLEAREEVDREAMELVGTQGKEMGKTAAEEVLEKEEPSDTDTEEAEINKRDVVLDASLSKQIEDLANMIGDVDVSGCADEAEAASKRIKATKSFINVGKEIKQLDSAVQNLRDTCGVKEEQENKNVSADIDSILRSAKSLKEITDKVPQFEYEEFKEGGKVTCAVCDTSFKYSRNLSSDFSLEKKMAKEFSNLKTRLRDHLKSSKHKSKEAETEKKELIQTKEDGRSMAVAVRNGRLVYYLVKNGRPDQDFATLVQMNAANGADMGDINHSTFFVTKFIPSLATAVKRRWKEALSSPMVATGCR